ncbi:MAG: CRISPR-associated endoribonuclease Cas6 [Anaerolineales bacterium]|nr:CRISPR-associated endoribonuclease Cas6 [Anaerolineales bacterium]
MTNPSPDLYALIIRLVATQSGRLCATQGHLAHAAFLNILQQVDSTVSAAIHDMHGRKPFTISPLEGYGHPHKGSLNIKTGQEGWLRVTLLDPLLFQTFISYFLQGTQKPIIQLENLTFHISEILSTPGSHQLAGYDSLQNLHQRWAENGAGNDDIHKIALRFRTPTAFSMRSSPFRHMHILPDPPLVFGQLAQYWDTLTGSDTCDAIRLFCAENVVVARHKIETHIYQYRRSKQVGFVGKAAFEILDKEATEMIQHLNRLADLAFYTGVGSKTTQGMGQIARLSQER